VSPKLPGAIAALLLGVAPSAADDVNTVAAYVVSLGGINVATARVNLTDSAQHYDIALEAEVSGLGGLVASGSAKVEASGSSTATALSPEKFALATHANNEDFTIAEQFARGNVSAFIVTPPLLNDINRVPIERSQLTGVGDMLSGFIQKGAALDASLCQKRLRIFTGIERFDLGLSFLGNDTATSLRTGYQGPVVQCRIKYTPISGHFTTSEMTNYLAQSDQLYLWYAPVGDTHYFIPYRVLITTTVGDLSVVLTSLKP
jgi:hypothetical protein